MGKSKLLKCPFCGGEVSVRRNLRTGHTSIQCDYCRAWWTPAEHLTRNEITEAWNRRKKMERVSDEQEKAVLPIPCTKGFEDWTVKDYFQKINEELDEVEDAILSIVELEWKPEGGTFAKNAVNVIAEEAADTITAITSMLEAMGIDEQQRQAAQRRVNEHNRQRGRC